MVSGNSTGIPIRDTVIVTKYILPVTVCHRVSFADNPNVFAVFNGVFLADNHVILFLTDFIVYSDNCRVSCIGYRIGRFRISYYYIINSPRDGRGQQKSCQCRCQRVFRDSHPPAFSRCPRDFRNDDITVLHSTPNDFVDVIHVFLP